jgi:hypothetical protein
MNQTLSDNGYHIKAEPKKSKRRAIKRIGRCHWCIDTSFQSCVWCKRRFHNNVYCDRRDNGICGQCQYDDRYCWSCGGMTGELKSCRDCRMRLCLDCYSNDESNNLNKYCGSCATVHRRRQSLVESELNSN